MRHSDRLNGPSYALGGTTGKSLFVEELAASIQEFNRMIEEIAVLEMRVLF